MVILKNLINCLSINKLAFPDIQTIEISANMYDLIKQ